MAEAYENLVESEGMWEKLLPHDHMDIISRAVNPITYSSKKELYFKLHQYPILLDQGKVSFELDMDTGMKCIMLSARELGIVWGDSPQYWEWVSHPNSRFAEAAKLKNVCWLYISGTINASRLSYRATYNAYLVFKLTEESNGFESQTQKACISIGNNSTESVVCIQPQNDDGGHGGSRRLNLLLPMSRPDGWMDGTLPGRVLG